MKFLLDSNILIYLSREIIPFDRIFSTNHEFFCSVVSVMEVLGYAFTDVRDEKIAESIVGKCAQLAIDDAVIQQVIAIRKVKRLKLLDAIIAATALTSDLTLITRDEGAFRSVVGLQIIDPFISPIP